MSPVSDGDRGEDGGSEGEGEGEGEGDAPTDDLPPAVQRELSREIGVFGYPVVKQLYGTEWAKREGALATMEGALPTLPATKVRAIKVHVCVQHVGGRTRCISNTHTRIHRHRYTHAHTCTHTDVQARASACGLPWKLSHV